MGEAKRRSEAAKVMVVDDSTMVIEGSQAENGVEAMLLAALELVRSGEFQVGQAVVVISIPCALDCVAPQGVTIASDGVDTPAAVRILTMGRQALLDGCMGESVGSAEDLKDSLDPVPAFVKECCVIAEEARVGSRELFDAYRQWCEDTGRRPQSHAKFTMQMVDMAEVIKVRTKFGSGRGWGFVGLGLLAKVSP